MPLIRQESIDAVLEACNMLEIVAPYTTIKKSGVTFKGKCPFHSEKTPSFTVDPVRKLYHCFGCGEGGNVFKFVESKEGLNFADAVNWLADKYGVKLQYEQSSPEEEERHRLQEKALSILDQAAAFYSRYLWDSPRAGAAKSYLSERGFNEDTIRAYRLGFAPSSGRELTDKAIEKGYRKQDLLAAGLVTGRSQGKVIDRFRGRLMFPFTDHRGRVLGFGARVLDESKPKYLNSPDSGIYHKSDLVFGLGNARQVITAEDRVYIVEGYTDVLAMHQAGIGNVVASMGTALTESQLKEVSRFTRNAYLAFDADNAGRQAMLRALELSRRLEISLHLIDMPSGYDPADLIFSEGGRARFHELAGEAQALLEYQVHSALSAADTGSAEGRVRAFADLKPIVVNAVNSVERDEQIRIIADRLRLSTENVAYLLESTTPIDNQASKGGTERRLLSQEETLERSFLSACLSHPGEAGRYLKDMTEAHFTTEPNRSAFIWVRDKLGDAASAPAMVPDSTQNGAGLILPELIIRAETGPSSPEALPELYLRLCEADLSRRISRLKSTIETESGMGHFRELAKLEEKRRRLLEHIQSGAFDIQ